MKLILTRLSIMLDDTDLVWDLQQVNRIAQSFSTTLDLAEISRLATDGLVEHFDCTLARIWLVEPDGKMLQLVASSGLYTHTKGSFSSIPMGEFKIGRIAQNRVSLLSNNLADESWIRYPEWAIANKLKSFAGYPLNSSDKVIGVLGLFSRNPMNSEFSKVLSILCTNLTVALEMAALHQKKMQDLQAVKQKITLAELSLSDNLAFILDRSKLTVLGTERNLDLSQTQLFLKVAEILKTLDCTYCRLTYGVDSVSLEAISANITLDSRSQTEWETVIFGNLFSVASYFGGRLKIDTEASIKAIQISLTFSSSVNLLELPLRIQCHHPLLQTGFTQLAYAAGLKVCVDEENTPLLTDQSSLIGTNNSIIWINYNTKTIPDGVKAKVDLAITSGQLREAVTTVLKGDNWGFDESVRQQPILSHREREVIALLTQGLRDRDIAKHLYISDSTVKFHINNILVKLEAKTRLQALYKLMSINGSEL